MELTSLPSEILIYSCEFMDTAALRSVRETCHRLREVVDDSKMVSSAVTVDPRDENGHIDVAVVPDGGKKRSFRLAPSVFADMQEHESCGLVYWLSQARRVEFKKPDRDGWNTFRSILDGVLGYYEQQSASSNFHLVLPPFDMNSDISGDIVGRINSTDLNITVEEKINHGTVRSIGDKLTKLNIRWSSHEDFALNQVRGRQLQDLIINGTSDSAYCDLGRLGQFLSNFGALKTVTINNMKLKVDNASDLSAFEECAELQSVSIVHCPVDNTRSSIKPRGTCLASQVSISFTDSCLFDLLDFPNVTDLSHDHDNAGPASSMVLKPIVGKAREVELNFNSWKSYELFHTKDFRQSNITELKFNLGTDFNVETDFDSERMNSLFKLEQLQSLTVELLHTTTSEFCSIADENIEDYVHKLSINCANLSSVSFHGETYAVEYSGNDLDLLRHRQI